jgi:outer membrane protein assembly factor BamD (BamD/ComL family)
LERAKLSIERALGARLGHADRAEALTLRAELALARGEKAQARAIYLEVSQRFAELPAGENALFAAARTQSDAEAAAKLLARYLARYPNGRFVDEAKKRLAHLVRQQ